MVYVQDQTFGFHSPKMRVDQAVSAVALSHGLPGVRHLLQDIFKIQFVFIDLRHE
jgi:hypothetical protein